MRKGGWRGDGGERTERKGWVGDEWEMEREGGKGKNEGRERG